MIGPREGLIVETKGFPKPAVSLGVVFLLHDKGPIDPSMQIHQPGPL